jgi:hypothetical protein
MQLIDEIIDLAVNDNTSLSTLLRKCLVLSYRLKNERLKVWAEKELDGYKEDAALPDYRETHTHSKGHFWGSMGTKIENYPIPTVVLKKEHQALVEKASLREGIAAYQLDPEQKKKRGYWSIPWSPNLVAMYQSAFFQGEYVLVSAWQEVPASFIAGLNGTIRNRVLGFALELQQELGSAADDPAALSPDRVDRTVIAYIFGGHVVIADRVEDVTQVGSVVVMQGDLTSLTEALKQLGADKADVQALENAIEEDRTGKPSPTLGQRTLGWIQDAALKLASKGGDAALDVAKAQMTAELTRLVSQFLFG